MRRRGGVGRERSKEPWGRRGVVATATAIVVEEFEVGVDSPRARSSSVRSLRSNAMMSAASLSAEAPESRCSLARAEEKPGAEGIGGGGREGIKDVSGPGEVGCRRR